MVRIRRPRQLADEERVMSSVPEREGAWWVEPDDEGGFYVVRDGVQVLPNPKFSTREEYEKYVDERSVGEEAYPPRLWEADP